MLSQSMSFCSEQSSRKVGRLDATNLGVCLGTFIWPQAMHLTSLVLHFPVWSRDAETVAIKRCSNLVLHGTGPTGTWTRQEKQQPPSMTQRDCGQQGQSSRHPPCSTPQYHQKSSTEPRGQGDGSAGKPGSNPSTHGMEEEHKLLWVVLWHVCTHKHS